jgi:hypothetical protein
VGDIQIENSVINLTSFASSDSISEKDTSRENNWKFTLDEIELKENLFSYNVLGKPYRRNSFDPSHINIDKLNLSATGLAYSSSQTKATISEFSFIENNGFTISKLEGALTLNETSAVLENFKFATSRSEVDGNFVIGFNSLKSIGDSIANLHVMADIENAFVFGNDILYFQPEFTFSRN